MVRLLSLPLLYLAAIVISTRFATAIHEFSHGIIPLLYGGSIIHINISMFAGGFIQTDWYGGGSLVNFLFSMSGIISNIVAGVVSLFIFRMIRSRYAVIRTLLIIFSMINLIGGFSYVVIGLYYRFGDPVGWIDQLPQWYTYLWIPSIIITPLVCYYVARDYSRLQQELFPVSSFPGRMAVSLLTLGAAIGLYAVIALYTDEEIYSQRMSDEEKVVVRERVSEEIIKIKRESPALPEEELAEKVKEVKKEIVKEEVKARFPLVYPYAAALLFGGLVAIYREKNRAKHKVNVNGITMALLSIIAVLILAILYYLNGDIYVR